MIHLTKIFHFEAAHALMGYDGRCRNIHGHSYEMRVTIKGMPIDDPSSPKHGMVMDFGDLKKIVNEEIVDHYDHAFIINDQMPKDFIEEVKRHYERIIVLPYQPTTELMLLDFSKRIKKRLPQHVSLVKILLKETEGSYAELIEEE
ncbi:MAG: 6-carboxytetrahydropterin synthase [Bacteroidales bacterium]|nr:6-carboxytetrahydropterin synthase [Bacteroidales bacterium]